MAAGAFNQFGGGGRAGPGRAAGIALLRSGGEAIVFARAANLRGRPAINGLDSAENFAVKVWEF